MIFAHPVNNGRSGTGIHILFPTSVGLYLGRVYTLDVVPGHFLLYPYHL
jgi:hypothetical protein